jgi:hypothetical protein
VSSKYIELLHRPPQKLLPQQASHINPLRSSFPAAGQSNEDGAGMQYRETNGGQNKAALAEKLQKSR